MQKANLCEKLLFGDGAGFRRLFVFPERKEGTEPPGPGVLLASAVKVLACHPHVYGGKSVDGNNCDKYDEKPDHLTFPE